MFKRTIVIYLIDILKVIDNLREKLMLLIIIFDNLIHIYITMIYYD